MKKLLTLLAGSTLALYMQGCSDSGTSANDGNPFKASVYVFGSNRSDAGELRWIDEDGEVSEAKVSLYQDSRIFPIDGKIFVLEGLSIDNISVFDPSKNKVTAQIKLDDSSNPVDVVKANDDEVWVALQNAPKIVKVSVEKKKVINKIKTKDFIQGKAISPNVVDLEVTGDTLIALFQRMDENWGTPAPGLIALYTLDEGKLLDTIRLAKYNPQTMGFAKGKLYVGSIAGYSTEDNGIEVVDLAKKKSSVVVDGKKLGGGVFSMALNSDDGIAYVAVYEAWGTITLAQVNLSDKSIKKIKGISNIIGSLAYDSDAETLYIGNDDYFYSYKGDKVEKIENAAKDALQPYGIAILK
ncbi:hypothetical protein B7990_11345 [Fibrobacter sp. UWB4]|uniref:hypothetical protein n=1 Tax=Fibrobacter sp. UWB4 TaxID=1964356 RepID=UPI000B523EBB|nr:hypothetical protein [Fibrobacter sp. UWB4]OWV16872.1 hypothetical protein B7990_11345 [Fibrobacter sp. UWB4]